MSMNLPMKYNFSTLPTKIEKLKLSQKLNWIEIYIKRDDQTGFELSGNKVRKLEYLMYDLIEKGYTSVITCGALQSNHVRATAACAAKLGLSCIAVLKGDQIDYRCNFKMTHAFGANVQLISEDDYKYNRGEIMYRLKKQFELTGEKVYIIPEGASNGLGNLGYYDAYHEIVEQEQEPFDMISVAMGSCGTYAGLYIASAEMALKSESGRIQKTDGTQKLAAKKILGINIYDAQVDFNAKTKALIEETIPYLSWIENISYQGMDIRNDYVGGGYGKTSQAVYDFMADFAKTEGILLDPVYTGKAMYGLYQELKKLDKTLESTYRVLFIHTGGAFVY